MNPRLRKVSTLALTVPLPASVAASPMSEVGGDEWLPEVRDSGSLVGPTIARGQLVDAQGNASQGQVVLLAWPRQEVLSRLEPGDHVKLVPVAKAVVGSDGAFALRVDTQLPLSEFMEDDGRANLDIVASSDKGSGRYSFAQHLETTASERESSAFNVIVALSSDRESGPTNPAPTADAPAEAKGWTTTLVSNYPASWDVVGEIYTGPNTTADFVYSQGAASSLGVGISASGGFGTWSTSGTSSFESTATIDFPTQPTNAKKGLQTKFRYGKYRVDCWTATGGCGTTWTTKVNQFSGGTQLYNIGSAPGATYCTSYVSGSSVTINNSTAITFTNGMSMSAHVGIDFSTRTGFTTDAKIKWTFVNNGLLCGSNTYPTQAARVVGK